MVQRQEAIPQNEYQKSLDLGLPPPRLTSESVRYWSDFNRLFYNPKSIVQLNEYELNSQLMPFEKWGAGEELFNSLDREHDILDRDFRPFAEESDQMSAIQIFAGVDDAWGGFAARYVDRLRDEYGKKDIWVWALEDGVRTQRVSGVLRYLSMRRCVNIDVKQQKKILAMANSARSMGEISPQTTTYVPIMLPPRSHSPYVTADLHHKWYSSALLTMALESVTLPTRLRQYGGIGSWLADRDDTRRIFNLQFTITGDKFAPPEKIETEEAPTKEDQDGYDRSRQLLDDFRTDFSPFDPVKSKEIYVFTQARVSRNSKAGEGSVMQTGKSRQKLAMLSQPNVQKSVCIGAPFSVDVSPRPSRLTQDTNSRFYSTLEFPVLDSFPHDLVSGQTQAGSTMGVRAALSSTTAIGDQVKELRKFVGRALASNERETLGNGLADIEEAYRDRWDSESDSGED